MPPAISAQVLLVVRLALVFALYAFIIWVLWTLWRDLKSQRELITLRQSPPLTLIREGYETLHSYQYTTPEVIIGRDPSCDFTLDDSTVSAQHARLSYHHRQWWVEDLNSTNGTHLNQELVTTPLVITSGDQLRFGQVSLNVTIGDREIKINTLGQ